MIGVLKDVNCMIMNNSSQLSNLLDIKSAVISTVGQEDDMVHLLTIYFLLDNLYFSKYMAQISGSSVNSETLITLRMRSG